MQKFLGKTMQLIVILLGRNRIRIRMERLGRTTFKSMVITI